MAWHLPDDMGPEVLAKRRTVKEGRKEGDDDWYVVCGMFFPQTQDQGSRR